MPCELRSTAASGTAYWCSKLSAAQRSVATEIILVRLEIIPDTPLFMHRSVSGSSDGGRSSEGRALDSAGDEPGGLPLHPHAGPPHPPLLHHSSTPGLPCQDDSFL